jgi:single-strand DNA-binding protein
VSYSSGSSEAGPWKKAVFTVAHTRRKRNRAGEWGDVGTTWYSVECWRALADGVRESISKGDPVVVSGTVHLDEWADDNGVEHSKLIIGASVVGHDLSRGRTRFERFTPIPEFEPFSPPQEPRTMDAALAALVEGAGAEPS